MRLGKDRHGLPIGSTGAAAVAGGSAVAAAVLMRQAAKMFALPRAIHREWLERLMNRATACVMSEDAESEESKTVGKNIQRHFAGTVAEARRYLRPPKLVEESMEEEDVREGIVTDGESEG